MGDLTRFQHQVLNAAKAKEQEKKEERQEEMRQQHGSHTQNSRASGGSPNSGSDMEQEETVRYINKNLNPDHEVHESD